MVKVHQVRGGKSSKSKSGFLSGIKPISKPETGISMLIYGHSGTGKTRTACTFEKPLLLVRAEEGTRSVYTIKGIDTTPVLTHPDELMEVCDMLQGGSKYKTVVLDTGGAYQNLVLANILGEELPEQLSFGTISRDQYQDCSLQMKERLKRLFAATELGVSVIVLAQERAGEDSDDSSNLLTPTVAGDFSPAVSKWLNAKVDYIAQTFIHEVTVKVKEKGKTVGKRKKQFCLRIGPHEAYRTKFRMPPSEEELPDYVANPSFDKIKKYF